MKRKLSGLFAATCSAGIVLVLSGVLCFVLESYLLARSKGVATQAANQMARHLNQHLIESLSATYALAALVRSKGGDTAGFESLAEEYLTFEHGLSALQLAPKGVVRHIVPRRGNEKAIGHDLFADPKRSAEANLAVQTGKLTLAGPFELVQGGEAIIGRLPVFLGENRQEFWGFTIALIKMSEFLQSAQVNGLGQLGYSYELWRLHPDTGKRQVFANSPAALAGEPVDAFLDVPNGHWNLSLTPTGGWYDGTRLSIEALAAILLSLFVAWLSTERKLAKESLRLSEERYRIVADNTHDWEFWLSADNRFLYNSPSCKKVTGYFAHEFEEDPNLLLRILHPDDVEIFTTHRHDAREMNVIDEVEFRILRPDGSIVWLAHTCQPVFDEQGGFTGTRGSNKEITARKQAEEERGRLIAELRQALAQVKQLSGFLPICASCKKIRDDNGYWTQIESYIRDHSEAEFSHGICPECAKKLYPEYYGPESSV